MAYINVTSWTPDQVTDWLKGLDDSMYNYVNSFTNNEVNGFKLLNIRPYELEQLGIFSIGHQEIVLEAVESLRNFHYNLDKENLQFLALQVASASENLYRQLTHYCLKSKIENQVLNDITRTIAKIKPLVAWLERTPFKGQLQFNEIKKNLLRLGLEMATMALRDRFVENPVEQINATAKKLAKLADYIIQDISDPMLLQPASLNLVTLKKRESELGFNLVPSYHGIHKVTEIKYNSPAHTSGKIEDGDEIIQINYQTVVGWQYKTVILHLRESSPDVLLTLKKRPKHTKIYGQIYMQPYRLPSKKRSMTTRWGDNLPSPRANFLAVPDFNLPLKIPEKNVATNSDTDSSCSDDILTPNDSKSSDREIRMYYPKPRAVLQRRNTICGDELSYLKNIAVPSLWYERKSGGISNGDPASPSLRDKSISFGFGLEIAPPRPTTCIGISGNNGKYNEIGLNTSVSDMVKEIDKLARSKESSTNCSETSIKTSITNSNKLNYKPGVCKVVRFGSNMKIDDYPIDNKYMCNIDNTILETFEPIPYADDEEEIIREVEKKSMDDKCPIIVAEQFPKLNSINKTDENTLKVMRNSKNEIEICQSLNTVLLSKRGRLDKSHSTPTYDNSGEESDTPPAIEPRKEFLLKTPPLPPPRSKKPIDSSQTPVPPPKPPSLIQNFQNKITLNDASTNNLPNSPVRPFQSVIGTSNNSHKHETNVLATSTEKLEFELSLKTKGLTSKKKSNLMAKRRKINLNLIGTGDIQGYLYRRTKDKLGVIYWAKLYFVLIETVLYGFRTKDAKKASCLIFLSGFTVCPADEVHSKPFAFKVYHEAKTFYFAAESSIALTQWMEFIQRATLKENPQSPTQNIHSIGFKELYSETDDSDESSTNKQQLCSTTFSNQVNKSTNTKEVSSVSKSENKYLDSLKKLTKSSLTFKHNSHAISGNFLIDKKKNSDIPEPTEDFRSFKKKPGSSYGVQIGAGFTKNVENNSQLSQLSLPQQNCIQDCTSESLHRKLSLTAGSQFTNKSEQLPDEGSTLSKIQINQESSDLQNTSEKNCKSAFKASTHSFIHASNPNLIEFDQLTKTIEIQKMGGSNTWDTHNNLQGFQGLTLKDLMLQKQEEEAQDMYNNRVLLGVEKKDKLSRNFSVNSKSSNFEIENGNISNAYNRNRIQMRSLPKTPDYEMSFKLDDEDIKKTRTKEGLKLRDFGYELIPGDDISSTSENTNNKNEELDFSNKKKKQLKLHGQNNDKKNVQSINKKRNCSGNGNESFQEKPNRNGSFKKHIGKFETFKTSSDKFFHLKGNSDDVKNTAPYTPMTLPTNKKSSNLCNLNIQQTKIKKSKTYNSELKDVRKIDEKGNHRKNSAPMPILSKFPFTTSKEKTLLGSPSLHRAIFGKSSSRIEQDYDHEIFCPINFNRSQNSCYSVLENMDVSTVNLETKSNDNSSSATNQNLQNQSPEQHTEQKSSLISTPKVFSQTPEYPNIECPPVFEPETYSLSDPNASLTLLRRRNTFDKNN